jgi:hypothetical protein
MKRFGLIVLVLAFAGIGLSACGKRGNPEPPGPTSDVTYPKAYPTY